MFKSSLILLATLSVVLCGDDAKSWGYRNKGRNIVPEKWGEMQPKCLGSVQSPINVDFASTQFDANLGKLNIKKHGNETEQWDVKNNGHSVVFTPVNTDFSFVIYPQKEEFKLLQLHFHWRGSEHFVNGIKYAGELHLVHQSKTNPNQFSVIGFLLQLVNADNLKMKAVIDVLADVTEYEATKKIDNFELNDMVPFEVENFFRYSGSLTTPGCDEFVEWNLADKPVIGLSENQILEFQSLLDNHKYPILSNSRPVQEINDRIVKRSFYPFEAKARTHGASGYSVSGANKFQFTSSVFFTLIASAFCFYSL